MTNVSYRYRQIDTFGRSTIRRFDKNMSALKQLAARNYEDALQVLKFNSIFGEFE